MKTEPFVPLEWKYDSSRVMFDSKKNRLNDVSVVEEWYFHFKAARVAQFSLQEIYGEEMVKITKLSW